MNAPQKTTILVCAASLFLLAHFPGFAQEGFKLSDYKNPDYTYRMLDFNFNLDGNNSFIREKLDDDLYKRAITRFNASLSPTYNARKNTAKYQGIQWADLSIQPGWNIRRETIKTTSNVEEVTKMLNQNYRLSVYSNNRFYNPKQQFVELGLYLQSEYGFGKEQREYTPAIYPFLYKNTAHSSIFDIGIPVMVGIGRIEEVQDARLAVYILEDLTRSGDLTREPDADEILELARFITRIKNKRYFDQRLRHISEITAIDSLLDAMGLKAKSGASYYTLLNDNWSYSAGPVRSSGSRFSVGFLPTFRFQSNVRIDYFNDSIAGQPQLIDYNNERNGRLTTTGIQLMAQYHVAKPINLYWQNSTSYFVGFHIDNEESKLKSLESGLVIKDETLESTNRRLYISASNTVGYYPNSRTSLQLGAHASYNHNFFEYPEDENEVYSFSPSLVIAGIHALADYYVSPRLRLNLTLQSNARFETEKSKPFGPEAEQKIQYNSFNTYLAAGFVYSIF